MRFCLSHPWVKLVKSFDVEVLRFVVGCCETRIMLTTNDQIDVFTEHKLSIPTNGNQDGRQKNTSTQNMREATKQF